MALIGNRSVLHKSPCRHLAGKVASGDRSNWSKHGMTRNAFQAFDAKAAIPSGALSPVAWVLPKAPGGMAARYTASVTVSSVAGALMGLPAAGDASFVISVAPAARFPLDDTPQAAAGAASFAVSIAPAARYPLDDAPQAVTGSAALLLWFPDAIGEVIASAAGAAGISVSCNLPLLIASLLGAGSASLGITTASPVLGAKASGGGTASFAVSVAPASRLPVGAAPPAITASCGMAISAASTSRLPANDASPLRTGAAGIAVSGVLVPYAIGVLGGSTQDNTSMTPGIVARAVWAAVAAEFADAGTMGRKLNDLAGGVEGGGLTPEQSAALAGAYQEALLARQLAGNRAVITDTPGGKTITIYADDGVTAVHTLTISIDGATREPA